MAPKEATEYLVKTQLINFATHHIHNEGDLFESRHDFLGTHNNLMLGRKKRRVIYYS